MQLRSQTSARLDLQGYYTECALNYSSNKGDMYRITRLHWRLVTIGSGNGFVPSGETNLDPDLCHHMASVGHREVAINIMTLYFLPFICCIFFIDFNNTVFYAW